MASHQQWQEEQIKLHDITKPFAPENGTALQFKVGDAIVYTNDQGASFNNRVIGLYQPKEPCSLYASGYRYLLDTDCHWMPVKEANLQAKLDQETLQPA